MRKLLRWLVGLLGVLLVLGLAAILIVSTAWFEHELKRRIVAKIEDATGTRAELRDLRFELAEFRLTLHEFTLRGTEPASAAPLLSARSVVVGLTPVALLRRRLMLHSLESDDASVHVYRYPDGTSNVPFLRHHVHHGGPLSDMINLAIGRLTIARTQVFYNDQELSLDLTARDVAVRMNYVAPGRYAGTVSSPELVMRRAGHPLPPIDFSSQVQLTESDILVTSLTGRTVGARGQGSATLHLAPSLEGNLSIQAHGDAGKLAAAAGFPHVRGGVFSLDAEASFGRGNFGARGRLQANRVLIHSPSVRPGAVDVSTDFSANSQRVLLPNFTLAALGGAAQGRAEILLIEPSPKFRVDAQLHGLQLDATLRALPSMISLLPRLPLASEIGGTVTAEGRGQLAGLSTNFDLRFRPPTEARAGTRPVSGFARGKATFARGLSLDLRDARLEARHSTLTVQGAFEAQQSDLAFRLATSDFEEWRALIEAALGSPAPIPITLKSTARLSGTITGPMSQLTVRDHLSIGKFEYRGWTFGSLQTNFVATPSLLQLSSGRLAGGGSQVNFDVYLGPKQWKLTSDSTVRIAASTQRTPLAEIAAMLNVPYPVSGLVTARIDLHGTLSNLDGGGAIRTEKATIAGESIDLFSADIRALGPDITFENIQVAKGTGRITGHARVNPTTRAFSTELHGSGFALADFQYLNAGRAGIEPIAQVQGAAGFDLKGQGRPQDFEVQSKVEIQNLSVKGEPLGDFSGQLDWRGQQLQLQGQLQRPDGKLAFGGTVRTEGDWPAQLTAQYANFRADPWIRLCKPNMVDAAITASGTISVTGPLKQPSRLEVRDRTQSLRASYLNFAWSNDQPIEASLANSVLTINRFQMRGPSTNFQLEGSVKFGRPSSLSISAEGQANASLLTLLDPSLTAAGRFDLKVLLSGSPSEPQIYGTLNVQNVSFAYAGLPLRVGGLKGQIDLQGDRLTIISLTGASGQGTVQFTGSVSLTPPMRADIRADFDHARVEYPIDFSDILSGTLRLTGTAENAVVAGDVAIKQMYVPEDFDLMQWMARVAGQTTGPSLGTLLTRASKLRLDINVASDPQVRVQSRELTMAATVDLRLQGNLRAPVAFGDIHIQSGEAAVRGNRYKLSRGDIALANPFRTEPVLDIEAQTRIEHYDVTLNLTGPADRFRIGYRSDPPLPSSEVLSLLAFGSAPQEQATTTTGTSSGAQSLSLLSQALSNELTGRVQRLFGGSRIRVDPNAGGFAATGGSRLTVEQRVASNLTITYVYNTAISQQKIIQFDWDINDTTELIGERDQNGVLGLELRFHHRFK